MRDSIWGKERGRGWGGAKSSTNGVKSLIDDGEARGQIFIIDMGHKGRCI